MTEFHWLGVTLVGSAVSGVSHHYNVFSLRVKQFKKNSSLSLCVRACV
jgi:hypothetical protein